MCTAKVRARLRAVGTAACVSLGVLVGVNSGAAPVDPDAKFTHFRVGERNVKRIFPDGDHIWVGTSGGVIRYNTKTDDYRLFDVRSGLLANGRTGSVASLPTATEEFTAASSA